MIDMNLYPVPHPQVAARIVDGTAVIILSDAGRVNMLNGVGTRVWELADGKRNAQEIANTIVAEYQVTDETARADVASFLQILIDARAVTLKERSI